MLRVFVRDPSMGTATPAAVSFISGGLQLNGSPSPMPAICLNVWPINRDEWNVVSLWRWADLVERAIFLAFALMLGYTLFVLLRFLSRCLMDRLESVRLNPESSPDSLRGKRILIADLGRGLGTLKAIGSAAPFLGLAGTTYLILDELSRGFSMSKASVLYYLTNTTASSLVSAAAGIIVAVPAVLIHNILRSHVEKKQRELSLSPSAEDRIERRFRRAQTLPLKRRFASLPPFAIIGVTTLACAATVFMTAPSDIATGLSVFLLPIGPLRREPLPVTPVVISVVTKANAEYSVRLNSVETPVDQLEEALAEKLKLVPGRRVYVESDPAVFWGQVAKVIDITKHLGCDVILLTTVPARNAKCGWPAVSTQDSDCGP